jgi:hypothetical protein
MAGVDWFGLVWFGVISFGVIGLDLVWFWCGLLWCKCLGQQAHRPDQQQERQGQDCRRRGRRGRGRKSRDGPLTRRPVPHGGVDLRQQLALDLGALRHAEQRPRQHRRGRLVPAGRRGRFRARNLVGGSAAAWRAAVWRGFRRGPHRRRCAGPACAPRPKTPAGGCRGVTRVTHPAMSMVCLGRSGRGARGGPWSAM